MKKKKKNPIIDIADVKSKTKAKTKSHLKSATEPNTSRRDYATKNPIPDEARENPVEWASKRMEYNIPEAAMEIEYQLKFSDDKTRRELALEVMSFKGITKKNDSHAQVVPAIQLIFDGNKLPWNQPLPVKEPSKELVEGSVVKTKDSTNE